MSLAICAWCLRPVDPRSGWVALPTSHRGPVRLCVACLDMPDQARLADALGFTARELAEARRVASARPAC